MKNISSNNNNHDTYIIKISNIPSNPETQTINLNTGTSVYFSAVKISPFSTSSSTTLYVGTQSGRLFRVNNINNNFSTTDIGSQNFPTANVLPGNHILPMKGVYCVNAYIDKQKYYGISNFGERPTVDGKKLLLETHIFDFNRDIYGKELTVEFLTFIRPEQKFENFEELTIQIKKDILRARTYHKI